MSPPFLRTFQNIASALKDLGASRTGQIPSLDGLRAIAITVVIAAHSKYDFVAAGGKTEPHSFFSVVGSGWVGVDLFFVLSGFLIGKLLLEEFRQSGSIRVLPFLLRRGLRIWPLYYFVCLVTLFGMWRGNRIPNWTTLVPDFLLLTNYFGESLAYGSWSLSVEEQFYIIVPILLLVLTKKLNKSSLRTPAFLAMLVLLAPFIRILKWAWTMRIPLSPHDIEARILHNSILTHYDGLVIGLFLASVLVYLKPTSPMRRWLGATLGGFVLLTGILSYLHPTYFHFSFLALGFGFLTWHCLTQADSLLTRILSWPGFQILSRLSYGMYLWYRFPLWRIAHSVTSTAAPSAPPIIQYLLIFILAFSFAILTAFLTYIFVEAPFLRLRSRLSARARARDVKMIPLYSTDRIKERNASTPAIRVPTE